MGQTNVGHDKRGTDKRGTGQTWDRTNVGHGQTWDRTNVGQGQTWDRTFIRQNVGQFFSTNIELMAGIAIRVEVVPDSVLQIFL